MQERENVDMHLTILDNMDKRIAALEAELGLNGHAAHDNPYNDNVDVHALQMNEIAVRIIALEYAVATTVVTPVIYEEPPEPELPPNPPGNVNTGTGANYFDLSNAIIVDESTMRDANSGAKNIFDNPAEPYTRGIFMRSTWTSEHVADLYVIVNVRTPIKVKAVNFYHFGPGHSVNFYHMERIPRNFAVYSGASETGPWILQGSNTYVLDPTDEIEHPLVLSAVTTSQFWKLTFSGQTSNIATLSEAVFMRG